MSVSSGDPASGDREIEHRRPTSNAWWPVMTAFGFALLVLGLVVDAVYAYGGILLIVLSAVEWTVSAWADRHSDDPVANKLERDRLMRPVEVPVFAVLAIAIPVFLLSRLLLAISVDAAAYVAIGISVVVLGVAFVLYAWSGVRREILTAVLAIGGIAVLVGGVVAMANGERDFEHHVEESAEESPEGDEGTATDPATGAEGGEEGSNPATEPDEEGGAPAAGESDAEDGTGTTDADAEDGTETTDAEAGGGTETTDAEAEDGDGDHRRRLRDRHVGGRGRGGRHDRRGGGMSRRTGVAGRLGDRP